MTADEEEDIYFLPLYKNEVRIFLIEALPSCVVDIICLSSGDLWVEPQ